MSERRKLKNNMCFTPKQQDTHRSLVELSSRIEGGSLSDAAEILRELDRITGLRKEGMMLAFTVFGNPDDQKGNPVPYHRTTQGSYWNAGSKRYAAWKEYVIAAYEKQVQTDDRTLTRKTYKSKPITLGDRTAEMWCFIEWHNGVHGDGSNVLKGIEDALFVDDKNIVEGHFYSQMSKDKQGSVRVIIRINEKKV